MPTRIRTAYSTCHTSILFLLAMSFGKVLYTVFSMFTLNTIRRFALMIYRTAPTRRTIYMIPTLSLHAYTVYTSISLWTRSCRTFIADTCRMWQPAVTTFSAVYTSNISTNNKNTIIKREDLIPTKQCPFVI